MNFNPNYHDPSNCECKEENEAIAKAKATATARAFALNINFNILIDEPVSDNTDSVTETMKNKLMDSLGSPENLMSKFLGTDENEAEAEAEAKAKIKNNNINVNLIIK